MIGAKSRVFVVSRDLVNLQKLMQFSLGVLKRPIAVFRRRHVQILGLFDAFLLLKLEVEEEIVDQIGKDDRFTSW